MVIPLPSIVDPELTNALFSTVATFNPTAAAILFDSLSRLIALHRALAVASTSAFALTETAPPASTSAPLIIEASFTTSTTLIATAAAIPTLLELVELEPLEVWLALPVSVVEVALALDVSLCALGKVRPLPSLFVLGLSLTCPLASSSALRLEDEFPLALAFASTVLVTVDSAATVTPPNVAVISRALVASTVSSTILIPTDAPMPTLLPATSAPTVVATELVCVARTSTVPEASSSVPLVPIRAVVSLSAMDIATEGDMATLPPADPASAVVASV